MGKKINRKTVQQIIDHEKKKSDYHHYLVECGKFWEGCLDDLTPEEKSIWAKYKKEVVDAKDKD